MSTSARYARITFSVVLVAAVGATLAADQKRSAIPAAPDDKTVIHVLNRIGFGPRPGDLERVRKIGLDAYVGSSRVDLQACKLEYSIVSPK